MIRMAIPRDTKAVLVLRLLLGLAKACCDLVSATQAVETQLIEAREGEESGGGLVGVALGVVVGVGKAVVVERSVAPRNIDVIHVDMNTVMDNGSGASLLGLFAAAAEMQHARDALPMRPVDGSVGAEPAALTGTAVRSQFAAVHGDGLQPPGQIATLHADRNLDQPGRRSPDPQATIPADEGAALQSFADLGGVALELDLRTRTWKLLRAAEGIQWRTYPQTITAGVLQSICEAKRRRRTGDAKDGEHRAETMIRQTDWYLTPQTQMEDLECYIAAVVRCLWQWSGPMLKTAWCVGGSVAATLAARDGVGEARVLRFCLCASTSGCWVGDGISKIGSSCKFHCDGIEATNVKIGGKTHERILLKKCTWMKCCYGKKPFGCPPLVPWCRQCECQKNLDRKSRRAAPSPSAAKTNKRPKYATKGATPERTQKPQTRSCHDCIAQLATRNRLPMVLSRGSDEEEPGDAMTMKLCGSCRRIMGKVDEFCSAVPLSSVGSVQPKQQAPAELRRFLREVLVRMIGAVDIPALASKAAEPLLISALLSALRVSKAPQSSGSEMGEPQVADHTLTVKTMWHTSDDLRDVLVPLLLKDIAFASFIFESLPAAAAAAAAADTAFVSASQAAVLGQMTMDEFIATWSGAASLGVSTGRGGSASGSVRVGGMGRASATPFLEIM